MKGLCNSFDAESLRIVIDNWGAIFDFELEGCHTIIAGYNCTSYCTTSTFDDSDLTWVFLWTHDELYYAIQKHDPCHCDLCELAEERLCLCYKCHKAIDPNWSP